MSRRVFISYEYDGDKKFVDGIKGMLGNPNIDVDFYDESVRDTIHSSNAQYIKSVIKPKINRASILLVIVGRDTHTSEWVKWEIETARQLDKRVVFMRRKNDLTSSMPSLQLRGSTIKNWDVDFLTRL